MKKIMIMALVAMFTTTAFAQNPEALKQIKKAKTAEEAQSLIDANTASMTAAENAQAYNKLVDIYMKDVTEEETEIQAAELEKQMGQEPKENVDLATYYKNVEGAIKAALMCDKYDVEPNEKGKVSPKYQRSNGERLFTTRVQLINAAQAAQQNDDSKKAGELYALYVTTGKSPIFAEQIAAIAKASPDGVGDPYISEVARVGALIAAQEGDIDNALKMTEVMLEDPTKEEDALSLKMYFMGRNLENHADSLRCLDEFKALYERYPQNEDIFSQLAQMYGNLGQTDEQKAVIDKALQVNPSSFAALAMRGQMEMNSQEYDAAISDFEKALACPSEDTQKALVDTFIGFCYSQKAAQVEIYEQQLDILRQAIPYLEKARELDPNRERANWAYPLYQGYYIIKGEDDPATLELKSMLGL